MLLLALLACEVEGDEVGECTDGADNDADGYFDCDDDLCRNSPDCTGEGDADTDADADGDTDTDSDADSDVDPAHYEGVFSGGSIGLVMDYDFNPEPTGVTDCAEVFSGTMDSEVAASGMSVTFAGTFGTDSYDCVFDSAVWDNDDGAAYHTFVFDGTDGSTLDAWFVHSKLPSGTDADGNGYDDAIEADKTGWFQMDAEVSGGAVEYEEAAYLPEAFLTVTSTIDIALD
jgi:hypothetical protein